MNNINFNAYFSGNTEKTLDDENKNIYREWKKFISGDDCINPNIISQPVLDAWLRCRDRKIDPRGEPQNPVLTSDQLREKIAENETFINISQPFILKLFKFMKDFSFAVALFDGEGYLLKVISEDKFLRDNEQYHFRPGALWTEEYVGNSCVSHTLSLKKPFLMLGAQHYLKFFHFITAACAPIINPEGELQGGIIVTTFYRATHPHTLGMSIAAAHAIENELKAQQALLQRQAAFEETDIVSSLQRAILSSIPEGLIAVNQYGLITTINEQARNMFGLKDTDLTDLTLSDIFPGEANRPFLDMTAQPDAVNDAEVRIHTAQSVGDYSLTCRKIITSGGAIIGKMLIFSEIKRIKSLVAKYIGAKANFQFKDMCCQNSHFKRILDTAFQIAQSTSNVLLLGESGTGKDILAQAIHNASPRCDGPYVAINCAAIPRDLIASELFGHVEGAFTGARRGGNQGKFELADGGTIFLDEIAETPLEIQAVLLRVIEDKCVIRIGSSQIRTVDVRIISATNRDLLAEVNKGNFRKDLYYRLNVFNISLPPLRARTDDIPLLVDHFIKKYSTLLGKSISGMDDKVMDSFMRHSWPGNIRELQNAVERMVNYAQSDRLTMDLILPEIIEAHEIKSRNLFFESPDDKEKALIRHLLALKFKRNQIAKQLNLSRSTLYRKIKKYGFENLDPA